MIMGSYGIGLERNLAAIVEANHDEKGICWPVNTAPYEVVVSVVKPNDVACHEAGEALYEKLRAAGIDVILDDRDERPGFKFKDSELVGFPIRIGIGEKSLAKGEVEIKPRAGALTAVKSAEAVAKVLELIAAGRA